MPTTDAFALLDALFTNAPVGLAFWDTELRFRRVNAALAAINGIAPADHLGATPAALLGPLGESVEDVMRAVLADRTPRVEVPFEGETPASPGDLRQWRASFYPVTDGAGEVLGIGAVVLEVTRERVAEREQQTTSALLDAIVDAAPVGIAFWDRDLRYRRVNRALAEINGVPAADHLGRTATEVLGDLGEQVTELLRRCAESGEAVVDQRLERGNADGTTQVRHTTIFPVVDPRGEVAGVAGVVRDVTEQHAAEAERTRLLREALTARAAAEAAQVRAEAAQADAEAARLRADVLAQAGERLARATRDYDTTLQEVAAVAVPAMADAAALTLLDAHGVPRTAAVAAGVPADRERAVVPADVAEALRTGAPVLRADRIAAPVRTGDRALGVLSLAWTRSARDYGPDDRRFAESLASRAALAVENARLYADRTHVARTLQRSLLPAALPAVPGLELAARYRAAGEQNEVGGDFYDVFGSGEGSWTVLLGDVSGKGAEAAALTSLTRHTLRAAALRTHDPIESLQLLNEALYQQADAGGRFSTVLVAQVRPDAGGADVRLATGGHLPPVVLRDGGRVERVQLRGAIVGALREARFGERSLRLEAGDLLLLHTDGVTELRLPGSRRVVSGEAALEEVLGERRGASAEEVVAAVERRAVELQAGDPRDDIALLAVRARP